MLVYDEYGWRRQLRPDLNLTSRPDECLAVLGRCLANTGASLVDLAAVEAAKAGVAAAVQPAVHKCVAPSAAGCFTEWTSFARRVLSGEYFLVHTAGSAYEIVMGLCEPHTNAVFPRCPGGGGYCELPASVLWQLWGPSRF